jgi:hypothetical protein
MDPGCAQKSDPLKYLIQCSGLSYELMIARLVLTWRQMSGLGRRARLALFSPIWNGAIAAVMQGGILKPEF